MVDAAIYLTYFLFFIAAIAAFVMPILNSLDDPKSLMGIGIAVGAILVVFLISYGMAGDEVTAVYQKFDVDASDSKMVGGSIITMYLLLILAVVGIAYSEVSKFFK